MGHHRHRRHHHHRHRSDKKRPKTAPVPVPVPVIEQPPRSVTPKILSNIHPIYLEESVQGGIGQYVSVSVLDPVMRVERSGGDPMSNPCEKPVYRIILSFRMQLSINRRGNDLQRHNRIFDSVSVRYLYRKGEKHDLLPKGDSILTDISISHETGKSSEVEAGIAGASGHIAPAFTVHAQHASKLTYERTMASWRKALTYEAYPPMPEIKPAGGIGALFTAALSTPEPEPQNFRVSSSHAENCACRRSRRCRRRTSRHNPYDHAAHWTGQTEAQLHLWTPEIYENLNSPLTITREVNAEEIDEILAGKKWSSSYGRHVLRKYLHFDFDVEVRLREIGWGFWNLFKSSSKPPEIRAKNDHGKPLPPDKIHFCVTCCTERVNWPQFETRDLQTEAEEQTAKHGYVRRLQSTEEYEDSYNHSRATVESSASTAAMAVNSTNQMMFPFHRGRITHSPEGRFRIFGRCHSRERTLHPHFHYRDDDGRDTSYHPRERGRSRDRHYSPPLHMHHTQAHPATYREHNGVRGPAPPPAPTPPSPSPESSTGREKTLPHGHVRYYPPSPGRPSRLLDAPPAPIPIPTRRRPVAPYPFELPIRHREAPSPSPSPPRKLLDDETSSLEDFVLGRMSMSDDEDVQEQIGSRSDQYADHHNDEERDKDSKTDDETGDDDEKHDLKQWPKNQRRRATEMGERDYDCKLLTPMPDSEDKIQGLDFGKHHHHGSGYGDARSKSRSSYRQPTVVTVSSESDDGAGEDAAQHSYESRDYNENHPEEEGKGKRREKVREVSPVSSKKYQEMKEVDDDGAGGSSRMKRDLLREIAAMNHPMIRVFMNGHGHGGCGDRIKKYIWDEHRGREIE